MGGCGDGLAMELFAGQCRVEWSLAEMVRSRCALQQSSESWVPLVKSTMANYPQIGVGLLNGAHNKFYDIGHVNVLDEEQ
jgi:hypothetical protein